MVEGSVKEDIDSLLDQVRQHITETSLRVVCCMHYRSSIEGNLPPCVVCLSCCMHDDYALHLPSMKEAVSHFTWTAC